MPIIVDGSADPYTVDAPNGGAYVTIGDLTITPGTTFNGVTWDLEPIDGWDSPASVEFDSTPRVLSHGSRLGPPNYVGRDLELTGTWRSQSWAATTSARNLLVAAIPPDRMVDLTVWTPGEEPLTAKVQLDGKVLVRREGLITEFSVALVAPDPRRYATTRTVTQLGLPQTSGGLSLPLSIPVSVGATVTAGRALIVNPGDMESPCVLTIIGPCPPCNITLLRAGQAPSRLNIPEYVPAGRQLVLDSDTHTALLDGVESRSVTGRWFHIEPGDNQIAFNASSYEPAAVLSVAFTSARR